MTGFSRRRFIATATGATAALGLPAIAYGQAAARVVVIGGGFGGATAARYLKKASPKTTDAQLKVLEEGFAKKAPTPGH